MNRLMINLLDLSRLLIAYVHMVLCRPISFFAGRRPVSILLRPQSFSLVHFSSLGFSWSLCLLRGSQQQPSLDFCHASVFVFLSSTASVLVRSLATALEGLVLAVESCCWFYSACVSSCAGPSLECFRQCVSFSAVRRFRFPDCLWILASETGLVLGYRIKKF
jgi:hypothetical protein